MYSDNSKWPDPLISQLLCLYIYKLSRNQIVLCVEVGLCKDLIYNSTTLQPHGASINSSEKDANFNPNTTKSYKILQKLSPKHSAHGVAQSTYPNYRHGKACLSKQPPLACSWGPSPTTRQVPGSSPGSGGRAARAFFSTLPSFLLPEIVFSHLPHQPRKKC